MYKTSIRTMAFLGKELGEIFYQPGLVLALVLGPFLILLAFGLGYTNERPALRIAVVASEEDAVVDVLRANLGRVDGPFRISSVSADLDQALAQLARGEADAIVILPHDVDASVTRGEHAVVRVLYNEIDPVQDNYLRYVVHAQVSDLNRQALLTFTEQGIDYAKGLKGSLTEVRMGVGRLEIGLRNGDLEDSLGTIDELEAHLAQIEATYGPSLPALEMLMVQAHNLEASPYPSPRANPAHVLRQRLRQLRDGLIDGSITREEQEALLEAVKGDVNSLEDTTTQLSSVPPEVLVSPFVPETKNLAYGSPTYVTYYSPAVLALLLQHVAVTLTALSVVRERTLGAMELFRVSPTSPAEILTGKFIVYALLTLLVGGALSLLMVGLLGVPMLGDPRYFWLALGLIVFASVGYGLLISLVSKSERQAVQLAMLMLISSVFFSGFLAPVDSFAWPVRGISYLLPVTYGVESLQAVMLRGSSTDLSPLMALAALGLVLGSVARIAFQREFRRE